MNNRMMKEEESPAQFALEIGQLAKLAYPSFEESNLSTIHATPLYGDYQRN